MVKRYKQHNHKIYLMPAMVVLFALMFIFPIGRDWQIYNVDSLAQIQAPYSMDGFTGMPFAFFALPHSVFNIEIGNAVNLLLNIIVIVAVARRFAGARWHIVTGIVLTAPTGINLIMSNNIDWIPLAAFLGTDWLAYPMLAMKPQMLAGAAVIRFKRNPNPLMLIPLVGMILMSVLIWGAWWQQLGARVIDQPWNFAPFPYLIPVGCWLLWQAWKQDDEIMAACSTMFFVPYFAPYSITGVHVLVASKYKRVGIWLWIAGWWFMVIAGRRLYD